MLKAQAVGELLRAGDLPAPIPRVRTELQAILDTDLSTYQASRAIAMASRLLTALDSDDGDLVWPSTTPHAPVPLGWWPYERGDPHRFEELDLWCFGNEVARGLQRVTQGERDRQREAIDGPPPWRRGTT
jgi:hypothetical protein